jgi:hypothetical protein
MIRGYRVSPLKAFCTQEMAFAGLTLSYDIIMKEHNGKINVTTKETSILNLQLIYQYRRHKNLNNKTTIGKNENSCG